MLVRINFGWKAGHIQDIEPVAAREMLADGRASAVSYEAEVDAIVESEQFTREQVAGIFKVPPEALGEAIVSKSAKSAKRNR